MANEKSELELLRAQVEALTQKLDSMGYQQRHTARSGFVAPETLGLPRNNPNQLKAFNKMINEQARSMTIEEMEQTLINEGGFH